MERLRIHVSLIVIEHGTWARSEQNKVEVYARYLESLFQPNDIASELDMIKYQSIDGIREYHKIVVSGPFISLLYTAVYYYVC